MLARRTEGGVAALLEDGALALLNRDGTTAGAVRLPLPRGGEHGEESAGLPAAKVRPSGDGWLAVIRGGGGLVSVAGDRAQRLADGGETIHAFDRSGEHVAVVRRESVELWTLGNELRWRLPEGRFVAVALAGRALVALRADGELVFVSVRKGTVTGSLRLATTEEDWHLETVDDARVAVAFGDWVIVIDVTSEKIVRRIHARARVVALAANDKRIAVGLEDGWLQVFDAFTCSPRAAAQVHAGPVIGVAMADGSLFTAARGGPIRAWDEAALSSSPPGAPITAVAARGALVAFGDRAGLLRVRDAGADVGSLRLAGAIGAVAVGQDGWVTASAGSLVVRLTKPWTKPHPILLQSPSTALAVDAAYAFSGTEHGAVDVYGLDRGAHVTDYALSDAAVTGLVRLPGALLVVGTGALDGRIFVVDVAKAKVMHRIDAHQEAFGVTCLATDPRGRIVASGSDDGTIALVDAAKGRVLARVRVPETPTSLGFHATGRRLAAVLANGSAVVVALDQRAKVTPLAPRTATHVAWDGDTILVGLASGQLERVTPG